MIPVLHIKKGQEQMGLYKVGLFLHDPLQLQDRQVVAAALGMEQRLVILFYGLAGDLQLARLPLDLIQIMVRPVILRLEVDVETHWVSASEVSPIS